MELQIGVHQLRPGFAERHNMRHREGEKALSLEGVFENFLDQIRSAREFVDRDAFRLQPPLAADHEMVLQVFTDAPQ